MGQELANRWQIRSALPMYSQPAAKVVKASKSLNVATVVQLYLNDQALWASGTDRAQEKPAMLAVQVSRSTPKPIAN